MRNPAPLVLTTLLAASATFFIAKTPEGAKSSAPAENPAPAPSPAPGPDVPHPTVKTDTARADAAAAVWPQEASDIPADPKARFGKLPNGLRYIIYPNAEPPKRVSVRLHIAAGSLMESDEQQGLAHFLEHMVFNGSRNYSNGELIPKMQHLGIGFGAHVNAYTSWDETVYMLDLPDLSEDTLKLGFTVMRDFGDGAKLDLPEIDKERGVILSEKTSRDSVSFRLMEQQFNALLPQSLVAKRFPIGTEEVISKAPRERFVDFYTKYYTPERMTFVVVGDIDPAAMEQRIKDTFGSMTNPAEPGKNPEMGRIVSAKGVEPAVFSDKEVTSTDLSLVSVRPYEKAPDTKARRLSLLPLELAHSIIGRRFERIAKEDGSPIVSGSANRSDLFNTAEIGSFDVTAADDRWKEALPVMEQEFRRALEYGFTEGELTEAKANLINEYEQAVKTAPTRKSETMASGIAKSINDGEVLSTPETDLEIVKAGLDSFTPEACHQAFRQFWADQGLHLILTAKEEPENAKAALLSVYEESRSKPVSAPEQKQAATFGYTSFGPAGTVTSRKEIADLGFTQYVLSNGVRLNFKRTDFEKSSIRLLARIGNGKLSQPARTPALDFFANSIFESGGLGKHSNDDLQQILAGRNVGCSLAIGEDSFQLTGRTTPDDLALQLQLMCAQLTDPGYREEAMVQFKKAIPMILAQLKHSPAGAQAELGAWLHGGDSRWAVPDEAALNGYTIEDARKWLTPALTKDYMELSIVGDVEESVMLPLILETFGALPPRAAAKTDPGKARQVALPKGPVTKVFTYDSKIPQGTVMVFWPTAGVRGNQKLFRRLNLAAEILSDQLREEIREKLGASYSPDAGAGGSDALDNYGFINAQIVGKPEDTQKLADIAANLAAEFAKSGTTDDALDRARKPILSQLEKSKRDNSYWLGTVLAQSQEDPPRLDLVRGRDADYAGITVAEINKVAADYLTPKKVLKGILKPKEGQ